MKALCTPTSPGGVVRGERDEEEEEEVEELRDVAVPGDVGTVNPGGG